MRGSYEFCKVKNGVCVSCFSQLKKFDDETIKEIDGFSDYLISNYGRVLSRFMGCREKKSYIGSRGYLLISMRRSTKLHNKLVHRLVAKHFVKGQKDGLEVNHIDGNKLNNHASNLEWCTRQENIDHSYRVGLSNQTGSKNNFSKLNELQVLRIKKMLTEGCRPKIIAKTFSVSPYTIYDIRSGKTWKHVTC